MSKPYLVVNGSVYYIHPYHGRNDLLAAPVLKGDAALSIPNDKSDEWADVDFYSIDKDVARECHAAADALLAYKRSVDDDLDYIDDIGIFRLVIDAQSIFYPLASECMRFDVQPDHYAFRVAYSQSGSSWVRHFRLCNGDEVTMHLSKNGSHFMKAGDDIEVGVYGPNGLRATWTQPYSGEEHGEDVNGTPLPRFVETYIPPSTLAALTAPTQSRTVLTLDALPQAPKVAALPIRKWGVWCEVSGGVTGHREAWLKVNGEEVEYDTQDEAETAAATCRENVRGNTRATFHYSARMR